jgi:hypothetical protein
LKKKIYIIIKSNKIVIKKSIYKLLLFDQCIIGSVVIDAEFDREDHGSIPYNCDREGAGTN